MKPSARDVSSLMRSGWPPLIAYEHGGWELRWSDGLTRRGNSATALVNTPDLGALRAFFRARRARAVVQVSPGDAIDMWLASTGFALEAPTQVRVSPLRERCACVVDSTPTAPWLSVVARMGKTPAEMTTYARVLELVELPSAFVVLEADGRPAAVGRAVLSDQLIDIQSMATLPFARRRGLARMVLEALMSWGLAHGATHACLAVEASNDPAIALYESMGFTDVLSTYAYRVLDSP